MADKKYIVAARVEGEKQRLHRRRRGRDHHRHAPARLRSRHEGKLRTLETVEL